MLDEEILRELPLMNLTHWQDWNTDLPADALRFTCDIRQSQVPGTPNPLTRVDEVVVQGQASMHHVRQSFDEVIGLIVDFYLGGEKTTSTEPEEGECIRCRQATARYFVALERAYIEYKSGTGDDAGPRRHRFAGLSGEPRLRASFWQIPVRQPARLSWVCAFDSDGRFSPKAYGMSYDVNDFFYLVEQAMAEEGVPLGDEVEEARGRLEGVIACAVREHGLRAENAACGWREGAGRSARAIIARWSSMALRPDADGSD